MKSQGLQITDVADDILPIRVIKRDNAYFYEFDQRRMNNLYRKIQIFKAQEKLLQESNSLVEQVVEANLKSDSNQILLQKEFFNLQHKFNAQSFHTQFVETELKKCKEKTNSQENYSILLEQAYTKAKREKYVIGVGLFGIALTYILAKG